MDRENFGRFIAEARRNAGLTQNDIANRLHVTNSAVSKWERGLCYPDITQMESLAQVLGLTLAQLLSSGTTTDGQFASPQTEESVSSLLDIAKESRRKQRKRIFGGMAAVLAAVAAAVLLVAFVLYYFVIPGVERTATGKYFGSLTKDGQNIVYMEWGDALLCLRCEDPALFEEITSHPFIEYYDITYRLDRWHDQEVLVSAVPNEDILGTPADLTGSFIGMDNLLGIPSVYKEILAAYPAPSGDGYLYNYRFSYPNGKEDIGFLNIYNCRAAAACDYDEDGIVELFVRTRYDNAPYILYDVENGRISSGLVAQIPDEVMLQLQIGH